MLSRRLFLGGVVLGAPAIVRASSIMPIWVPKRSRSWLTEPVTFWPDPEWEKKIIRMKLNALGIDYKILRGDSDFDKRMKSLGEYIADEHAAERKRRSMEKTRLFGALYGTHFDPTRAR